MGEGGCKENRKSLLGSKEKIDLYRLASGGAADLRQNSNNRFNKERGESIFEKSIKVPSNLADF
jgi:hypothetical protein